MNELSNKDILYSTGNYTDYLVITYNGTQSANTLDHYAVHLKHNIVNQPYFNKNKIKFFEQIVS